MSEQNEAGRRTFLRNALAIAGATTIRPTHAGLFGMSETKAPYPVTATTLAFGRTFGIQPIHWLDNDRVLIPAQEPRKRAGADGKDKLGWGKMGLYIWNVKTNSFSRYSDLESSNWIFEYDHGNIAYSLGMNSNRDILTMVGKMGEEKQVELKRGMPPMQLEPSKRPHKTFRRDGGQKSANLYTLLPQHGYIYVSTTDGGTAWAGNQNDKVKLYRSETAKAIELPILVKEMDSEAKFTYSDYLNKYVLVPATWRGRDLANNNRTWPKDEPYPIYLISPQGQVETLTIPAGYWYPGAAYPTRAGLFWVSNNTQRNSRDAGGWLLKEGKAIKLFDQLVDAAGVSPDGCTIVYASNDFDPKTLESIRALHLCSATNKRN